jgi:hypothetical protein
MTFGSGNDGSLKPRKTSSGFSYSSGITSRASLVSPPTLVVSRSRCGSTSTRSFDRAAHRLAQVEDDGADEAHARLQRRHLGNRAAVEVQKRAALFFRRSRTALYR